MRRPIKFNRHKQRGFVLIASMLMLVVLTFMAVAMYHNVTTQQSMTANTKEKGRAFQMAQSTLQYGEYELLTRGLDIYPTNCTAPPSPSSTFTVCGSSPTEAASVFNPSSSNPQWSIKNAMTYDPDNQDSNVDISTTPGQNTYYKEPQYYVQYLGTTTATTCPTSKPALYQVTALAFGASPNTVAVVQSTYQLVPTVCNIGAP
jgi:type IV pilus assembly protein PilX